MRDRGERRVCNFGDDSRNTRCGSNLAKFAREDFCRTESR
jgi:hypothetical protein